MGGGHLVGRKATYQRPKVTGGEAAVRNEGVSVAEEGRRQRGGAAVILPFVQFVGGAGGAFRDGAKAAAFVRTLGSICVHRKRLRGTAGRTSTGRAAENVTEGQIHELPEIHGRGFRVANHPQQIDGHIVVELEPQSTALARPWDAPSTAGARHWTSSRRSWRALARWLPYTANVRPGGNMADRWRASSAVGGM